MIYYPGEKKYPDGIIHSLGDQEFRLGIGYKLDYPLNLYECAVEEISVIIYACGKVDADEVKIGIEYRAA